MELLRRAILETLLIGAQFIGRPPLALHLLEAEPPLGAETAFIGGLLALGGGVKVADSVLDEGLTNGFREAVAVECDHLSDVAPREDQGLPVKEHGPRPKGAIGVRMDHCLPV